MRSPCLDEVEGGGDMAAEVVVSCGCEAEGTDIREDSRAAAAAIFPAASTVIEAATDDR